MDGRSRIRSRMGPWDGLCPPRSTRPHVQSGSRKRIRNNGFSPSSSATRHDYATSARSVLWLFLSHHPIGVGRVDGDLSGVRLVVFAGLLLVRGRSRVGGFGEKLRVCAGRTGTRGRDREAVRSPPVAHPSSAGRGLVDALRRGRETGRPRPRGADRRRSPEINPGTTTKHRPGDCPERGCGNEGASTGSGTLGHSICPSPIVRSPISSVEAASACRRPPVSFH